MKHLKQSDRRRAMNYDVWWKHFQPIQNHLEADAPNDGAMFETFGPEVDFVKSKLPDSKGNGGQDADKIWTLLDYDGKLYICAGWHFVNRIGYFITQKPWSDNCLSVFVC